MKEENYMKKIQTPLITMLGTLSKSLAVLSKQVEKMADKVNRLQSDAPLKDVLRKKAVVKKKESPAKKTAPKRKKAASASGTVIDTVLSAINNSKSGIAIAEIKAKTKIEGRQLSNALYKLTKREMIKAQSRGIYIAVKQ
jgi:hypothetical protein